ncbi:MAG: type II toxin-antitoxin system RelE family toxin [Acidimicrobiales bacterium]
MRKNPQRLARKLVGELDGLSSARRGDYRIIYEIIDDPKIVVVPRIQHRADVYRNRRWEWAEFEQHSLAKTTSSSCGRT